MTTIRIASYNTRDFLEDPYAAARVVRREQRVEVVGNAQQITAAVVDEDEGATTTTPAATTTAPAAPPR